MEQMLENPLPAILIGGVLTAALAGGWLQTGRRSLVYGMVAMILLTIGAVVLERAVKTDREKITATLYTIAGFVESNDISEALKFAHSGSPEVHAQAAAELPLYDFTEVSIKRNLKIEVLPGQSPREAKATFNVMVILSSRDGALTNFRVPRYVEVTMRQEADGAWRVAAYQHFDPQRGWTVEGQDLQP